MKNDRQPLTTPDAIDYQIALESFYGVTIVHELSLTGAGSKARYQLTGRAYISTEPLEIASSVERNVFYPSKDIPSFGTALLYALYALEEALRARATLEAMSDGSLTVFVPPM